MNYETTISNLPKKEGLRNYFLWKILTNHFKNYIIFSIDYTKYSFVIFRRVRYSKKFFTLYTTDYYEPLDIFSSFLYNESYKIQEEDK